MTTPGALNCLGFSIIEITLTFVRVTVRFKPAGAISAWLAFGVRVFFVFATVRWEPGNIRSMPSENFISHFGEFSFPEGKGHKSRGDVNHFHYEMFTVSFNSP